MSTVLLQGSHVTHHFGSVTAVDDVDVEVHAGQVVGLLGANGAGKTTLVRILLGLVEPSEGVVSVFGNPPSKAGQRRLGYVPQGLGLYDDLTPSENLAFARAVFDHRRGGAHCVPGIPEIPVRNLPLGVQRRLAFIEAFDHHPELLLLDEPTSGVSPLASARLWETVRDATDAGAGALVTTHNMQEAEQCDRLLVMAQGRVVATGTAADIIGDHSAVVVSGTDWARAFDALERAGVRAALVGRDLRVPGRTPAAVRKALGNLPAELRVAPATLEERFLELVTTPGTGSHS